MQVNPSGALRVEALERLLGGADDHNAAEVSASAERLWQAYVDTAAEIANHEQLLVGDDAAWTDYAARRLGSEPFVSRAFYGFLTQRAQNPEVRSDARLQLMYSLASAGLDYAALGFVQRRGLEAEALDAATRHVLGRIAARHNEAGLAVTFWTRLSPPSADWSVGDISTQPAQPRA